LDSIDNIIKREEKDEVAQQEAHYDDDAALRWLVDWSITTSILLSSAM
jgi:hypothetical protein